VTNTKINCLNCHRLLITSTLLCEKMYNDYSVEYKIENFIAKVGGIYLSDLLEMETLFVS